VQPGVGQEPLRDLLVRHLVVDLRRHRLRGSGQLLGLAPARLLRLHPFQPGGRTQLHVEVVVGDQQCVRGVPVEQVARVVDGELEQRIQRKQPWSRGHRRRGVGLTAGGGHPRHQDGPVLVRDDQVDDPRLFAGARVHQRAEHRDLVAARRAHPVAADPAWPGEQLGEVACVVGLRHPDDEVGQRLAENVGVRPAEQLLGLPAPVPDGAALVGLDHGDADR
jgi:hypothetical protein